MADYYKDVKWCINYCNILGVNLLKKNNIIQNICCCYHFLSLLGIVLVTIILFLSDEDMSNIKSFTDSTNNMLMVPIGLSKLITLLTKKSAIADLINDTKYQFWQPPDVKEIRKSEKFATFLKNTYLNCLLLCILSSILKPIIVGEAVSAYNHYRPEFVPSDDFNNPNYEAPVPETENVGSENITVLSLVGTDLLTASETLREEKIRKSFKKPTKRYVFVILGNSSHVVCILSMIGFDVLNLVLLMRVEVQFRILNNQLNRLFDFDHQKDVFSQTKLSQRLKECVNHHNFLIEFLTKIKKIFSGVTLIIFGLTIMSMSLRMYILSGNNGFNYKLEAMFHLIAGLTQIGVCYCIPSQAVRNQAEKIGQSIYCSRWYDYPLEAKNVLHILSKEAKTIIITAGGMFPINLEIFLRIIKTIVSYCTFLRTMEVVS